MYGYGFVNSFRTIGGVSFDPDAQAFITAASITDPTQQSAVNQLVIDLEAASIWTKAGVINPFVGGNATAHRYNLKTATADTTFYGGVNHNSQGVTYNGTTGYSVPLYPYVAANIYNRSMFQYIRSVSSTQTASWQGIFDGTNVFGYQACIKTDSGNIYTIANDGLNRLGGYQSVGALSYGLLGVSITASNSGKAYNDATVKITNNAPNNTPSGNTFYPCSGALNNQGTPALYGNHNIAFEFYGTGLTDTDVTNLNNAVTTFQTTLSRNV